VIVDRKFRLNLPKSTISLLNLLGSWRLILLAIALGSLREAYVLLDVWLGFSMPWLYDMIGTGFLLALILGLYSYYWSAREIRDFVETKERIGTRIKEKKSKDMEN
ncbi:MAG: hypothetical protein ABH950_00050, partial [Candidatus Altiarchaeota archaeon]